MKLNDLSYLTYDDNYISTLSRNSPLTINPQPNIPDLIKEDAKTEKESSILPLSTQPHEINTKNKETKQNNNNVARDNENQENDLEKENKTNSEIKLDNDLISPISQQKDKNEKNGENNQEKRDATPVKETEDKKDFETATEQDFDSSQNMEKRIKELDYAKSYSGCKEYFLILF